MSDHKPRHTDRDIDRLMDHVEARLRALPAVEAGFGEWDIDEHTAFIMEWSIPEQNLKRLRGLAARGAMSETQRERFAALERLAEEGWPILDRLRRVDAPLSS